MPITMKLKLPSHFDMRACEWFLGAMQFGWGVVLLLLAFAVTTSPEANPYFRVMFEIATQATWGLIALITGSFHLLALYWNGTKQKSPHLRAACSLVGMVFWLQVSLGFVAQGDLTPGWAVYPLASVFSLYNIMRAMGDARVSDDAAKSRGHVNGRRSKLAS